VPKRLVRRTLHTFERGLELRWRPRRGRIVVSPYRGFGREGEMLIRGRVLMEKPITRVRESESTWRNIVNTYHRFKSDEVAGAKVRVSYRDAVVETVSDAEGHFTVRLAPHVIPGEVEGAGRADGTIIAPADTTGSLDSARDDTPGMWREAAVEVPDAGASAIAHVMMPSAAATFAIISDIDDTIVQTNATNLLRMVRSIINNAASRLPFEGVAELYQRLHAAVNPIFYVSSSPWNLYELLSDYLDINGIPHGPMFLQDWGIDEKTLILASHTEHKLAQIQTLVDYYGDMKFVLIGDSGQHDPEIYLEVIRAHPGRVLAVFIRDVTRDVRDTAIARIANDAATLGVEMVYVKDSNEALTHAQRLGLV
jgi:phosphatidate phosphatase APP1